MSTIRVDLPDGILAAATAMAATDQVDLEEFVVRAVAERVEAVRGLAYLRERSRQGNREAFLAVLSQSPDVPPVPGDELE